MIGIGSDHAAFSLKEQIKMHLVEKGIEFIDYGCYDLNSVDYPNIATAVADGLKAKQIDRGILICGTGVGISIAANKIKGIRAALCGDTYSAKMTRLHNDANILCMGARVIGSGLAADIVDIFLSTEFEGGRHQHRIDMISEIEK